MGPIFIQKVISEFGVKEFRVPGDPSQWYQSPYPRATVVKVIGDPQDIPEEYEALSRVLRVLLFPERVRNKLLSFSRWKGIGEICDYLC